ncbi:MAG: alcohol dehydrogenase catalytic domain-containing protein [Oscillospiraceae bacterium]|nr:alcohol dehydrogenase catalytic domain-containing protein [Oscillospiraceae bacterium]
MDQKSMRGLVKDTMGPGELVYRDDLPIPEIGDDDVLIKIHCTAICGTDLHIIDWDEWTQKRVKKPVVTGHETAGDIVAVGKNVKNRRVGDRVSCESHVPCGSCFFCKNGMPHICKNVELFGITQDGAFAEYAKIRSDCTFLIPDGLPYEAGCLFEPMGAGVHGAEVANVKGKSVLVSGCGPIGLAAISACKQFGASTLIVCARTDSKLEVAKEMGADIIFNTNKVDLVHKIMELTDGIGVDVAIDVSGSGDAIHTALQCLRAGGDFVGVGLPTKPVTFDLANEILYREIHFTGISGRLIWRTWDDFAEVMNGPYFDYRKVLGGKFAIEDYKEAFARSRSGAPGKNLIYPDSFLT